MTGSKLIGWMLVIGVIVVLGSFFVEPTSSDDNFEKIVAAYVGAPDQANVANALGLLGIISILLGLAYYARRNQSEAQPDIVNIASSLAFVSVAIAAAALGVSSGITWKEVAAEHHLVLYTVSETMFMGVFSLVALSLILLAVGLFGRQTTLLLKASWGAVALVGLSLAAGVSGLTDASAVAEVVEIIGFLGLPFVFIVLGVRTIRSSE